MDADKIIDKLFTVRDDDNIPYVIRKRKSREGVLPKLFAELGFTYGAEIGVCKAKFSKVILDRVPNLKLLCVDMWIDHGRSKGENSYAKALEVLKPYNAQIINKPSMEAVNNVADNSLDFVYIDAAHDFDNVMLDLILWSKKVKVGGIISGHDYHANFQYGVIEAVNAYTRCHSIHRWYLTREIKAPSYFWVKKESHNFKKAIA